MDEGEICEKFGTEPGVCYFGGVGDGRFFCARDYIFHFYLLLDLDLRYWGRNPIDGFFFSFVFFSSCFSLVHIHQNPLLISPPRVTYTIQKM